MLTNKNDLMNRNSKKSKMVEIQVSASDMARPRDAYASKNRAVASC